MIHHHDFIAGEKGFQGAAQAQSVIPGMQERGDGGHGV
jgi:hypothetical protein